MIGIIEQKWNFFGRPKFDVKDTSGEIIIKIEGPFWTCSRGSDVDFNVKHRTRIIFASLSH